MEYSLDGNLRFTGDAANRRVACRHCGHDIGAAANGDYAKALPRYVGPPTEAGPRIWAEPSQYVDQKVVFRQYYCPGCYVAVRTEVVPVDHPSVWDQVSTR